MRFRVIARRDVERTARMDHRCSVGDRWPLRVPNRGKGEEARTRYVRHEETTETEEKKRGTPWRRVILFVKILWQWTESG